VEAFCVQTIIAVGIDPPHAHRMALTRACSMLGLEPFGDRPSHKYKQASAQAVSALFISLRFNFRNVKSGKFLKSTFEFNGTDTRLPQKSVDRSDFDFFVIWNNATYAVAF
jgi:hypothetical protein